MKPPLLLLVLMTCSSSLATKAKNDEKRNPCNRISKVFTFHSYPALDTMFDVYASHQEDGQYLLLCFTDPKNKGVVIRPVGGKPIVFIKHLDCGDMKKLEKHFYAFIDKRKYLALGFLAEETQWCRFDFCIDTSNNCETGKENYKYNPDVNPSASFFRWSKQSKDILPEYKTEFRFQWKNQDPGKMIAEYISIGKPKIVLNCYKGSIRLRTPIGQHITSIKTKKCMDSFIQTLFIFQMNTHGKIDKYRYKFGKETDIQNWSEIYDREYMHTWVNYYKAQHPSKNCYWRRIPNDNPNSCPKTFLKSGEWFARDHIYLEFRQNEELVPVAMYRNNANPSSTLRCFRLRRNSEKYFSVVLDVNGYHLITVKNLDCSSLANLKNFFVGQTQEDGQGVILIGSRGSEEDEWCTYSVTKYMWTHEDETYFVEPTWVYYGYTPEQTAVEWTISQDKCALIDGNDIKTNDDGLSQPKARYLTLDNSIAESLILECHVKENKLIGVIKKLSNEVIISIPGLPCESKSDLKQKSFIQLWKAQGHSYIRIGSREHSKYQWCSYDFCLSCDNAQAQFNLDIIYNEKYFIVWSDSATRWKQFDGTSYDLKSLGKHYKTVTEDAFVLMSIKTDKTKMILRNMKGTHFAEVHLNSDFSASVFSISLHFVVQNTESNVYNYIDCSTRCEPQLTASNQETLLFLFPPGWYLNNGYYNTFRFMGENYDELRTCLSLDRSNLHSSPPDFVNKAQTKQVFTSGLNPSLKMKQYTENAKSHAVFTLSERHVVTWVNLEKEKLLQRIAADLYNNEVVIGQNIFRQKFTSKKTITLGLKIWCWYNIVIIGNKIYPFPHLGYKPNWMATQWYKDDSDSCPSLKREDITVYPNPRDIPPATHVATRMYLAEPFVEGPRTRVNNLIVIKCHENRDSSSAKSYYSAEISSVRDKFVVLVKNLNCLSRNSLDDLYLFYQATLIDSVLMLGKSSNKKWCRYDIRVTNNDIEIRLNSDEDVVKVTLQWSEPGFTISNRPTFDQKFVAKDLKGKQINENSLKKTFYSTDFELRFITRCYGVAIGEYISVITSPRGTILGILTGKDCTETQFHKVFIYITREDGVAFHDYLTTKQIRPEEDDKFFCWYYGCSLVEDSSTTIFFFYPTDKSNRAQKIAYGARSALSSTTHKLSRGKLGSSPHKEVCKNGWCVVKDVGETTYEIVKKKEKINLRDIRESKWQLVVNYMQKSHPYFELLCYINTNSYFSTIIDLNRKHVLTIPTNDCSPKKETKLIEITIDVKDEDEGMNFVFVRSSEGWFSVHRPSGLIEHLQAYPGTTNEWIQVPTMDGCKLKPENILFDESNIPKEDKLVASYLSNDEFHFYTLKCYRWDASEYIAVIWRYGTYKVSFKGLDCSTLSTLSSDIYISSYVNQIQETLVVGAYLKVPNTNFNWCQYFVQIPRKTFHRATSIYSESKKFKWFQVQTDCPLTSDKISMDEIQVDEKDLAARYIDTKANYHLYCYKKDSMYLLKVTKLGGHVMSLTGYDCTVSAKMKSLLFMHDSNFVVVKVGVILHEFVNSKGDQRLIRCMYKIEWNNHGFTVRTTYNAADFVRIKWLQIPVQDSPPNGRSVTFSKDETKMAVSEDSLVARYMGYNGVYVLRCYKTDDATGYISVIKKLDSNALSHFYSIKGLDCSSSKQLNVLNAIIIHDNDSEGKIITVSVPDDSKTHWWMYDVLSSEEVKTKPTALHKRSPRLQWSENGILMRNGLPVGAEYSKEMKYLSVWRFSYEQHILGLECYKESEQYFVKLRTARENYILSIAYPLDCTVPEYLIRRAYIQTSTGLIKMGQKENHNKLFTSLQDAESELNKEEYWFYYIIKPRFEQELNTETEFYWMQIKECLVLRTTNFITSLPTDRLKTGPTLYNGRFPSPAQLECYESNLDEYASLTVEELVMYLKFKCSKVDNFDLKLYVDVYSSDYIIVGTRLTTFYLDSWCSYLVPRTHMPNKHPIRVLRLEHEPKSLLSRWYMGNEEECPIVKRKSVIISPVMGENTSNNLHVVYGLEVRMEGKLKDFFILYCYRTTASSFILEIHRAEGVEEAEISRKVVLLAAVKNIVHCGPQVDTPFKTNTYMFTYQEEYSESPMTFLAFGSSSSKKKAKDWCQYDICINNCPTGGKILLKAGDENKNVFRTFHWTRPGAKAFKSSWIDRTQNYMRIDGYTMKNRIYTYIPRKESVTKNFFLKCFEFKSKKDTIYRAVLQTNTGLDLAMLDGLNCYESTSVELGYITLKENNSEKGTKSLMRLDFEQPPKEGNFCWNFACQSTVDPDMIFVKDLDETGTDMFWEQITYLRDGKNQNCPLFDDSMKSHSEFITGGFEVVAKYKYSTPDLRSYTLTCYSKTIKGNVLGAGDLYLTIYNGEDGSYIATVVNIQCFNLPYFRKVFDIVVEKKGDVEFIIMDTIAASPDCEEYALVLCPKCNVKSWIYYKKRSDDIERQWTRIPTEYCQKFKDDNVVVGYTQDYHEGINALYEVKRSYISKWRKDMEPIILTCYQSKSNIFLIQLQTWKGKIIVSIKSSYPCLSNIEFNDFDVTFKRSKFYASVEKRSDGRTYLGFITPSTKAITSGSWCLYTVCVDCDDTVSSFAMDVVDPGDNYKPRLLTWSADGKDTSKGPQTTNDDMSESKIFSKHTYIAQPKYNMECRKVDRRDGIFLTIVNGPFGVSHKELSPSCNLPMRVMYFHAAHDDGTYSLVRLDGRVGEEDTGKTAKKTTVFAFDKELPCNQMHWELVSTLKMTMLDYKNFDESKEDEECLPRDKNYQELKLYNIRRP